MPALTIYIRAGAAMAVTTQQKNLYVAFQCPLFGRFCHNFLLHWQTLAPPDSINQSTSQIGRSARLCTKLLQLLLCGGDEEGVNL